MKEFKSFYKQVDGNEGNKCHYNVRLDTYGCGCQHDCKYCYAKSLLDFRNLWNPEEPAVADISKIKSKISRLHKDGVYIVRLGGMTDCFQPLEASQKVTYETIKALNEEGIEYLIVTKSDMVASDEYMAILDKNLAHIQITVTTTDDELSKTYEKAVVPSRRIKAIEKLQANGFDVALRLSPFIEEYIDFDILNNVKCDKIQVEFLRVNGWISRWFDLDYSDYTVKQSGYRHLPLVKKIEKIKKITGFKYVSVCEDENEAYKYWQNNFNPNPNDCCNLRNSKVVVIKDGYDKPSGGLF
ncbi:MAG: radical SAM protein [Paludibacteraceae bacterium]|nr:radical SAM protein [Paludibacteraceae bacterium]